MLNCDFTRKASKYTLLYAACSYPHIHDPSRNNAAVGGLHVISTFTFSSCWRLSNNDIHVLV